MIRFVSIALNIILTSFYFFPFMFKGYESMNTKKMMAVVGLAIFLFRIFQNRGGTISRNLFMLTLYAAAVSFWGFTSITLNETPDYAYASYIMSMWVWIGGAYAVCCCIRETHGRLTVRLLCNYLAVVCVSQCVLALMIDNMPSFKMAVDSVVEQGQSFLNERNVNRLYGIGASLDVAGSRFSAVLIILAFMISRTFAEEGRMVEKLLYLLAFAAIAVIGNIIARTTTVGLVLALGYWIIDSKVWCMRIDNRYRKLFGWVAGVLVGVLPMIVILYQTDVEARRLLRFGFEGFFSLIEKGTWEVTSNDKLRTMYVFPETFKTWVIGDGYFSSPQNIDPYFIGVIRGGYYMGTDVGYLRFIFYFGLLGLSAFIAFLCKSAKLCIDRFPKEKALFVMLLIVNFVVWFKVSTDIFLVFALFLMFPNGQSVEEEKPYLN